MCLLTFQPASVSRRSISLLLQFVEEMSHLDGKIRSAIILVISPLVSLMKVEVQYLQQKGIKALFIGGGQCKIEFTSLHVHELYGS